MPPWLRKFHYQNVRCVRKKIDLSYKNLIATDHAIVLLEIWLIDSVLNHELIDVRGNVFKRDKDQHSSSKKHGGGSLTSVTEMSHHIHLDRLARRISALR